MHTIVVNLPVSLALPESPPVANSRHRPSSSVPPLPAAWAPAVKRARRWERPSGPHRLTGPHRPGESHVLVGRAGLAGRPSSRMRVFRVSNCFVFILFHRFDARFKIAYLLNGRSKWCGSNFVVFLVKSSLFRKYEIWYVLLWKSELLIMPFNHALNGENCISCCVAPNGMNILWCDAYPMSSL
jgi:hypothetical protein